MAKKPFQQMGQMTPGQKETMKKWQAQKAAPKIRYISSRWRIKTPNDVDVAVRFQKQLTDNYHKRMGK